MNIKKLNEEIEKILNEIYGDYAYDVKIRHPFINGAELFYVEDGEHSYYKVGITADKDDKGRNIPIYIAEGSVDLNGNWIYHPIISDYILAIKDIDTRSFIADKWNEFSESIYMDELTELIKDRIS